MIDKFHTHRNIIGFDENGVSVIIHKADAHHEHDHDHKHSHDHDHDHEHDGNKKAYGNDHVHNPNVKYREYETDDSADTDFIKDYMEAIATYKKTFPTRNEVIEKTPDPAIKGMLEYEKEQGIENIFDRFDKQKPHCSFGIAGTCCKACNMGPCKITAKSPKGTCGADADTIVARNLLRGAAAGVSQHGMHAREVILSLKWAAEGKLDLPIIGKQKVIDVANSFGIKTKRRQFNNIAKDVADVLLDDLSNTDPNREYKTLEALAPPERKKIWKDLGLIPISAYHEVFEAFHKSGVGTDADWKSLMEEFHRCGLAFTFSGVMGSSIATDALFGVGDRVTGKVNLGALEEGYVNIALHGHLPTLVSKIVETGQSEELVKLAKENGAKGIKFYGICCSSLAAMYRYGGVIPLSNAVSAELVIATGAIDLWIADVQDVYPAIMDVANCFHTKVVTTSESARLPGAERIEYDHYHSNIDKTNEIAREIVLKGIERFKERQERGVQVHIPNVEVTAEVGFSLEYLSRRFKGIGPVTEAIKSGKILGIVNMVGCNNPKVPFERCIIDVAEELIKNNVLVLTNGCASYPLMKMGFCEKGAGDKFAGEGLKEFLEGDIPPVLHVGECIDNTRSSGIMATIAREMGVPIADMPYAFTSPEWSNEKAIDAALGFRLLGINSYHCVEQQVYGSRNVSEYLKEGSLELLGSKMVVNMDPKLLAKQILDDMRESRKKLGWDK